MMEKTLKNASTPFRTITVMLVIALGLSLGACGKKGDPTAPEDKENTYPGTYPSPGSY